REASRRVDGNAGVGGQLAGDDRVLASEHRQSRAARIEIPSTGRHSESHARLGEGRKAKGSKVASRNHAGERTGRAEGVARETGYWTCDCTNYKTMNDRLNHEITKA